MIAAPLPGPAAGNGDGPWRHPAPAPALERDEVHIWRASLAQPAERIEELAGTLSRDERRRAGRLRRASDRRSFIVSRGVLRAVLGRYLRCEPASLEFSYGSTGKPALSAPSGGTALRFNCSHSRALALYAVTRERRIGVDLEAMRPVPELERVVQRYFSASEQAELRALPPGRRLGAFLDGWTRKEAFAKAVGDGLNRPFDGIEVSLTRCEPPILRAVDGDPSAAACWTLQRVAAGHGYSAALAVEGRGHRLAYWQACGTPWR